MTTIDALRRAASAEDLSSLPLSDLQTYAREFDRDPKSLDPLGITPEKKEALRTSVLRAISHSKEAVAQRRLSVEFIRNNAVKHMPVVLGSKSNARSDPAAADPLNANYGIGYVPSSTIVDCDIDTNDDDFKLAYRLHNPGGVWYGRPGREFTHLIRRVDPGISEENNTRFSFMLRQIKSAKFDGIKLASEVRFTLSESEVHTNLPGHVVANGDIITFNTNYDPNVSLASCSVSELFKNIMMVYLSTAIAKVWHPGQRNSLVLPISGLFYYVYSVELEGDEEPLLGKADYRKVLEIAIKVANERFDEDEKDKDAWNRLKNFDNNWDKGETGAKLIGGTRLSEILNSDELTRFIRMFASVNPAANALALALDGWYVNAETANAFQEKRILAGRETMVGRPKQIIENGVGAPPVMMPSGKMKPFHEVLFKSQHTTRVDAVVMRIGDERRVISNTVNGQDISLLNLWSGWPVEAYSGEVTDDDVKPFLDYVREVLADNNEEAYEWVRGFVLDIFQKPNNKPGTALVLVSKDNGTGKSFLVEGVLAHFLARNVNDPLSLLYKSNDVAELSGDHNGQVEGKLLVLFEEATSDRQKKVADKLKDIITSHTGNVRHIYGERKLTENFYRIIFTSNRETGAVALDAEGHERRYTVLKVSNKYMNRPGRFDARDYFGPLHDFVVANKPKFMKWLLTAKYNRHMIERPLVTAQKDKMRAGEASPVVHWLLQTIEVGHPIIGQKYQHEAFRYDDWNNNPKYFEAHRGRVDQEHWPDRVLKEALFDSFSAFSRSYRNSRDELTRAKFDTALSYLLPDGGHDRAERITIFEATRDGAGDSVDQKLRRWTYSWPTRAQIVEHLKNNFPHLLANSDFTMDESITEPEAKAEPGKVASLKKEPY